MGQTAGRIMTFEEFQQRLEEGFEAPLPGISAQCAMAPNPRRGWQADRIPENCRDGAGLVLGYPNGGRATLVLTLRDAGLPQHAGQVSLPGGALDPGETIVEAAFREAEEEIGVPRSELHLMGTLTPLHIPASGFVLHPVVAVAEARPDFRPEPGEVERIIEVEPGELADPQRLQLERREFRGRTYEVPFLMVDGAKLWGATAMVLAELLSLIGQPIDSQG